MTVYLRDFLTADDNATPALVRAVHTLHDGDTLSFEGDFPVNLYPDGAAHAFYRISNNDTGDKTVAALLQHKNNITIDGAGKELVFHGKILPFVIDKCTNVTVKNLAVDYFTPQYGQAEIIEADEYKTVLKFDNRNFFCQVKDGKFRFYSDVDHWENIVSHELLLEFEKSPLTGNFIPAAHSAPYFPCTDRDDHGFLGSMFRPVTLVQSSPDTVTMYYDTVHAPARKYYPHKVGNYAVINHSPRQNPGFLVTESKDVTLSHIRLYHTSAMGVIGQLSENITLDTVTTELRDGRLLTLTADATHFVNCRGFITLKNCRFFNMMDDAGNIHGIYLKLLSADADRLCCGYGHHQQVGMNIFRVGDTVALINSDNGQTLATRTVLASDVSQDASTLLLTLDRPVPMFDTDGIIAENRSTSPNVLITGCATGYNRPRGFLVSSAGKVVIEKSSFCNMNQGVHISCEMKNWYESGAVTDVTVRDCDFTNSAYAGGVAINACPQIADSSADYFNGRIIIENCHFEQSSKRYMRINLAEKVIVRNNTYTINPALPYHPSNGETGITVTNCGRIESF